MKFWSAHSGFSCIGFKSEIIKILTLDTTIPAISSESWTTGTCNVMHSGRADGISSTFKDNACIDARASVANFWRAAVGIGSTLWLSRDCKKNFSIMKVVSLKIHFKLKMKKWIRILNTLGTLTTASKDSALRTDTRNRATWQWVNHHTSLVKLTGVVHATGILAALGYACKLGRTILVNSALRFFSNNS